MGRKQFRLGARFVERVTEPGMYCDGDGLYLRVTLRESKSGPSLKKSWIFRSMRLDGSKSSTGLSRKERAMGLGPVSLYSLAEARVLAQEARKLRHQGIDPITSKQEKKKSQVLAAAKSITFDECAKAYIESRKKNQEWKNAKHAGQWESTLASYASPILGKLPVSEIDTSLVIKMLDPIWERIPETASRVRNRIEAILDWATLREYRSGENPARWRGHLDKHFNKPSKIKPVKHLAALPFPDMPDFMAKLRTEKGIAPLALEFTILTAARSGETRGATWDEIDFKNCTWTIPAQRMKAKREHRVPLTSRAIEVLEGLQKHDSTGLIFTARAGGAALSDMSLTAVLRRMNQQVTVHGFRSTFRDWAAERTNFPREVAETALAHTLKDKVEAAYRRGDFFEKRRKLMESWQDFCERPALFQGEVLPIGSRVLQQ